jgi:secreted trypsin-like serine protease
MLVGAVGCGARGEIGAERSSIVGGTSDTGDHSVVLLYATKSDGTNRLCTGTVISPTVVLTAAHCLDPSTVGKGYTYKIFLGDDINDDTQVVAANIVNVKDTDWNLDFDGSNVSAGSDIGVVVAEAPLPLTPVAVNRAPLTNDLIGQTITLIGFGTTRGGGSSAGIGKRRLATTQLAAFSDHFVVYNDLQYNTCDGDSGGPAIMTINGQDVIVGLTSFGDHSCLGPSYDTRVDKYTDFLDSYAPPAPPSPPDMAGPPAPPMDGGMGASSCSVAPGSGFDLSWGLIAFAIAFVMRIGRNLSAPRAIKRRHAHAPQNSGFGAAR